MADNRTALKQLRDSIKAKINENPSSIIRYVRPMIDDGFGGKMEDPSADPTTTTIKCRISREKVQVQDNEETPAGLSTSFGLFILGDYQFPLTEGERFDDGSVSYTIGPVESLKRFGGVYAKQATITKVTS